MKLYYTGAKTFLGAQKDPQVSLGGLIGNTEIPNGLLSNLFGAISRYTVQLNKPEIRAFVVKNDGLTTLTGLKAYFTYPNDGGSPATDTNDCDYLIGWGAVSSDSNGDLSIESVSSVYSIPYSVSFSSAVGLINALPLPDMSAGTYLGIFVKRVLNSLALTSRSDDELLAIMDGTLILPPVEDITLTFAWN